jgi:phenylalanyl-tRNA synthetase alpha chain
MADEILLNEAESKVLGILLEFQPECTIAELAALADVDQSQVAAIVTRFVEQGNLKTSERVRDELVVTDGAEELIKKKLPERLAIEHLAQTGGHLPINEFIAWAKTVGIAPNDVFKWGGLRGWLDRAKEGNTVIVKATDAGRDAIGSDDADELAIKSARFDDRTYLDRLPSDIDSARVQLLLSNRPELAKIKRRTERKVTRAHDSSLNFVKSARRVVERNTLTPEDLESGAWREIKLRPYDVTLAARDIYPAKIHPLRKIIEQTRRAFLEMGFAEVVSPMVESAFWNFDALFQPQDHPAREMQDTFYMRHPAEVPLPGEKHSPAVSAGKEPDQNGPAMLDIVEQVRRTHEDGWETGSEGWGYTWSPERSRQVVLRTHTTAATIRALAKNPEPPGKFFCVGWTYRNETISFKHLPVFHQVDGIIIDEEANLASLMGTLQEFYSKMGFGRVKFKPAFYPYTEPSVDVVVYMESRGKWLEMGGAGIFRPEVTLPLGCKQPVLAWGLGIERLAMLRFGLDDIRELYRPSLDALEGVPLCR